MPIFGGLFECIVDVVVLGRTLCDIHVCLYLFRFKNTAYTLYLFQFAFLNSICSLCLSLSLFLPGSDPSSSSLPNVYVYHYQL